MNKRAFELSINFIVMLILAIAVFGFGMYFVQKVFREAEEIKVQLDKDAEERINLLLDRGDKIAFPITSRDIKQDGVAIFGLGVLNVLNNPAEFEISIECATFITKGGVEDKTKCTGKWTIDKDPSTENIFELAPFTLEKNERKVIPIAIQPPRAPTKPEGTYAFTVWVKSREALSWDDYGTPKQIYVNID